MSNKRKQFQIAQPELSKAENDAFGDVLAKFRGTGKLASQTASFPDSQLSSKPESQIAEPESQLSALASQTASFPASQQARQPESQIVNESAYPSRKSRQQVNLRLPKAKVERYRIWCFVNKVDMQAAVESAMDWLTSKPASHMLIDDNFDDRDDELSSIRRAYEKWTGNKTTPKDREAMQEVAHLPIEQIELGVMLGFARTSQGKINSFRYFLNTIHEVAASGVKDVDGGYGQHLTRVLRMKRVD